MGMTCLRSGRGFLLQKPCWQKWAWLPVCRNLWVGMGVASCLGKWGDFLLQKAELAGVGVASCLQEACPMWDGVTQLQAV